MRSASAKSAAARARSRAAYARAFAVLRSKRCEGIWSRTSLSDLQSLSNSLVIVSIHGHVKLRAYHGGGTRGGRGSSTGTGRVVSIRVRASARVLVGVMVAVDDMALALNRSSYGVRCFTEGCGGPSARPTRRSYKPERKDKAPV